MGSMSNPNPFPPYNTYKDCSLGICSIYCPQWCYIVFPPPPPSDSDHSGGTYFSPLVIAVIGILASAFLLVTYYTLATKYCRRSRHRHNQAAGGEDEESPIADDAQIGTGNDANRRIRASGLEESMIKSITVYKYRKGEGLVDGTDCSVCLSEFEENESLRLLPKCNHAFHLPCIDTWLKSHSSCPLCRSNLASVGTGGRVIPPPQPSPAAGLRHMRPAAVVNVSSHAYCHTTDALALVIRDDRWRSVRDEAVISLFCDDGSVSTPKTLANENSQTGITMRRSVSLNSWICGQGGAASSSDHRNQIGNGCLQ